MKTVVNHFLINSFLFPDISHTFTPAHTTDIVLTVPLYIILTNMKYSFHGNNTLYKGFFPAYLLIFHFFSSFIESHSPSVNIFGHVLNYVQFMGSTNKFFFHQHASCNVTTTMALQE